MPVRRARLSEKMTSDFEPSPRLLELSAATPLAVGHLRSVFQHPLHADELIKIMRADVVASRWNRPDRWLKRLPRTRHYIGYLRELKEYIAARARAPHAEPPIARMIGLAETDLGLGLVSEKVVDADGALAPTLAALYGKERGFTAIMEQGLAAFLQAQTPEPKPTLAAPGLSLHGQMHAVDFHVYKGDLEVAVPEAATIESVWDGQGWGERLAAAVRQSAAKFKGPLATPREPWHYQYTP